MMDFQAEAQLDLSDLIHSIYLSLQNPCPRLPAWQQGAIPHAMEDPSPILSFYLVDDLPLSLPTINTRHETVICNIPPLFHSLFSLSDCRWELLVAGNVEWVNKVRPWLGAPVIAFASLSSAELSSEVRHLASGCWILPVKLSTYIPNSLIAGLEAYQNVGANHLCFVDGNLRVSKRVLLEHGSNESDQLLCTYSNAQKQGDHEIWLPSISPLTNEPGSPPVVINLRSLEILTEIELLAAANALLLKHGERALAVEDPELNQYLLIEAKLWFELSLSHASELHILLGRLYAIVGFLKIFHDPFCLNLGHPQVNYLANQSKAVALPSWLRSRLRHGLLLLLSGNETDLQHIQSWAYSGFAIIPIQINKQLSHHDINNIMVSLAETMSATAQSLDFDCMTLLTADCLIATKDLDELRTHSAKDQIVRPAIVDRHSCMLLADKYQKQLFHGLTIPAHRIGSQLDATQAIAVRHTILAMNFCPPPNKRIRLRAAITKQSSYRRLRSLLESRTGKAGGR